MALAGVDLAAEAGEFLVVLGPSGSGKSTLLRLVAGLDAPSAGEVLLEGRAAGRLAPRDRDVALVSQDPAPYPHLDVFENLAFGLRARRMPEGELLARVGETAEALGLTDCLARRPAALSGGQRQRVALGRALARRPGVLLLDEPLSNLDAPLRAAIRADLVELVRRLGTTTILVTHDQAEALALGDRIAVLEGGRVAQEGPPAEVYAWPANRFVGGFLGSPPMAFLGAMLEGEEGVLRLNLPGAEPAPLGGGAWSGPLRRRGPGPIVLGLRAEHLRLAGGPGDLAIGGTVRRVEPAGHEAIVTLAVGPGSLALRLPAPGGVGVGEALTGHADLARASWFDPATGLALH